MTQTHNSTSSNRKLFDQPENLSQIDLEMGWLACIFWRPNFCREIGFCGLDASMFKNPEIFEMGQLLLRDLSWASDDQCFPLPSSEMLGNFYRLNVEYSTLLSLFDAQMIYPSWYKKYAIELETRNSSIFRALWT